MPLKGKRPKDYPAEMNNVINYQLLFSPWVGGRVEGRSARPGRFMNGTEVKNFIQFRIDEQSVIVRFHDPSHLSHEPSMMPNVPQRLAETCTAIFRA